MTANRPLESATAVPSTWTGARPVMPLALLLSTSVTVAPGVVVPMKVGVSSVVTWSKAEAPVSSPGASWMAV